MVGVEWTLMPTISLIDDSLGVQGRNLGERGGVDVSKTGGGAGMKNSGRERWGNAETEWWRYPNR